MHGVWLRAGLFLSVLLLSVPVLAQPTGLPDDLSGDAEARGFADLLFAHGMVQLADRNYTEALPLFEKAARTAPADATYAYFAALCKLRLGRFAEAIDGLRKVLPPAKGRINEARIRYDLGDGYYRSGKQADAQRELRRSVELDDKVAAAQFYRGVVAFALGESRAAMEAFALATALDPSLTDQGDYYSGVAAFERGDLEASRRYFERVLQNVSEPGTTKSGREWLNAIGQLGGAGALPPSDLRISFLMEHDDNPGQINQDLFLPGVDSDVRGVVRMRASHRPVISDTGNLGLVINSYISRHADFDQADLSGIQGVFQYAYGGDPLGYVNGPLGYARVPASPKPLAWLFQVGASNLSRRSGSLRRDYEIASTFLLQQPDFGKLEVSLSYDDVTFFDPFNRPYSGHSTTARLGQVFYLGEGPGRYLRLTLGRTAHDTAERALERDSDFYQAELSFPLGSKFNLFVLGAFREDKYDPLSSAFYGLAQPRRDETIQAAAKLTMTLTRHALLTFGYSFADRESRDLSFASYDRRISSLGYTRQW